MKQRVSIYRDKQIHWRKAFDVKWLFFALLFLASCSLLNRGPTLGDTNELLGTAVMSCSTACTDRGQCGTKQDGTRVVLGGQTTPMLDNHDRLFAVGAVANILESREELVEVVTTGEQFPLRFYRIQLLDGVEGWAAGWCLAAQ